MSDIRTREELEELLRIWQEQRDLLNTQDGGLRLVKLTAGHVPPAISQLQIIWTRDVTELGVNIIKWVLGEDNGVSPVAREMLKRLKEQ